MSAHEVADIFTDIVGRARALDPANARKWFDDLTVVHFDGGSIAIGCPDESNVRYLNEHCRSSFTRAAQQITGHLVTVDFVVGAAERSDETERPERGGPPLHPDYTFENFVVGPSNRLAHASCVAVGQSLGQTYNPLFLYGSAGLGKTHLLHAVCHEVYRRMPGSVIQLLSCEDFVNRFIRAIEQGNIAGFHSQFRTVDALVIDDIQFLREREQSQEEFFHTFNALYNSGKQIILSADSPPNEIPSIEARLISRFNWGLVARIDPPSYETRIAIVQKKAHLRGLEINDEIAEYIARQVQANIRELEGALTTIYAMATTLGAPVDLPLAQTALEGQIKLATRHISITDIIDVVTRHFDVRLADLQSKRRSQSITVPRQICMYLARNLTRHSLEEIGGHLGGRDHTTVMHACNKIAEAQQSDPNMQALLSELTKRITQGQQVA
ncbi:MAG TPA: chromosomal replication initiator protein DnaA [Sedimentisphaerales bacterium]|nr:chromosomal replication initiator protein DnaA [Sedimentisphaerales bacterium]HRS13327.1 chromosomal replication initiator protein DnaA [Sedimentisphaerales bacterium]HRV49979.1 chromosomal replication initiator protein DnaA [Sedimentisphaerales bacterium]